MTRPSSTNGSPTPRPIHGKAGVVTLADGRRTAFLGSANESKTAFRLNYELVWEDDSAESVEHQKHFVLRSGAFKRRHRDVLKDAIQRRELRLVIGTDAASEGLNLQRLGTLINLDLPWNPSRLEQRKGRIQRIGQVRSAVDVCNMRYADSVEDRVHALLSERWQQISTLFGQLPDTLEDVWVQVALGKQAEAQRTIDAVPQQHPFQIRYREVANVDWESCARVLDDTVRHERLARGWRAVG